ncbi:chromosome partitioning protein ParB, partial [Candidatus Bathyarchaeota archaeon]
MKVEMISIEKLIEPKEELRSVLVKENLEELAESIKELGILEPLIVRPVEDKYEVVAGHRRLLAAKIAELKEVPCVIKEMTDKQVLLERLHENL